MERLQSISLFCLLCVFLNDVCCQNFNPIPRNERRPPTTSGILPRSFNSRAIAVAFQQAEQTIASRRRTIVARGRPMNQMTDAPTFRHNMFQRSGQRSQQLESVQERFEEATRILARQYNLNPDQVKDGLGQTDLANILPDDALQQCTTFFNVTNCDRRARYRTFDGTCNNLDHPSWGMGSSCFERLMDPVYNDGISEMRSAVSGRDLPLPRTISLGIHEHMDNPTDYVTHIFMQFGQFLDHDFSLSPLDQGADNQPLDCCPVADDSPSQCGALILEPNDPFFSAFGIDCLNNARTVICSTCSLGARQQTNQITSYIDGSVIYGLNLLDANSLRTFTDGLLRTTNNQAGELLPESNIPNNDGCSFQVQNQNCFMAGDVRVNQHPALTSLHTIFLRQHNRLAQRLKALNPGWDDERLFQETRRIVGAQFQMIVYNEFLPLVIGPERMTWYDLNIQSGNVYTGYDKTVQANLINEFSTAAFRFGHSLINSFFPEISPQTNSANRLRDLFLWPFNLYNRGNLESVVRGMYQSPAQKFDRNIVRDVTNHLYQLRGNQSGLDLASLNVFRGRDHGIPPYINVVRFCGGPTISSFRDLDRLFQRGYRQLFQGIYESVEDIDLFTGGLAERPNQGAVVGPTFTCIIGIQFYHLKYGDRFYFEHGGQTGSFSPEQLEEIKKTTFARLICDNSDIDLIQRQVMLNPSRRNPEIPCSNLAEPDLRSWRE